jgi:hypothetical protein
MLKRVAAVSFMLAVLCLSTLARADGNALLGTWQLKSCARSPALASVTTRASIVSFLARSRTYVVGHHPFVGVLSVRFHADGTFS